MSAASVDAVYILANRRHGTLYIGVTNNLRIRLEQHRCRVWLGICQTIRRASPCLCGRICIPAGSDPAREAVEELAAGLEDSIDRERQSGLERSVPPALTPGVMGPGLRSQARLPGRRYRATACAFRRDALAIFVSQLASAAETARATAAMVAFCWSVESDAPVR
jgi:hypothetical protein